MKNQMKKGASYPGKAIIIGLVIVSIAVSGCGLSQAANTAPKEAVGEQPKQGVTYTVSFALADHPNDEGWNLAHYRGIETLKRLGQVVEETDLSFLVEIDHPDYPDLKGDFLRVNVVTNIGYSGADIERRLDAIVQSQGPDLLFATYWDSREAAVVMAKKYPELKVEQCSGYPAITSGDSPGNLATYFIAIEDGDYVVGYVAGLLGHHEIGLVCTYPIPEPVRGINAFTLGLQRGLKEAGYDPSQARVRVSWIYSWLDPSKEREAAVGFLEAGFKTIRQVPDTPTVSQTTCEYPGTVALGYGSSVIGKAPCVLLTNTWEWGHYYVTRVVAEMRGEWQPQDWFEGLASDPADDSVGFTDWQVPEETRQAAMAAIEEIRAGFNIFTGPIQGVGVTAEGKRVDISILPGYELTDMGRLTMQWFVGGVDSEPPIYNPAEGYEKYLVPTP